MPKLTHKIAGGLQGRQLRYHFSAKAFLTKLGKAIAA
jgi:hypothetical protein